MRDEGRSLTIRCNYSAARSAYVWRRPCQLHAGRKKNAFRVMGPAGVDREEGGAAARAWDGGAHSGGAHARHAEDPFLRGQNGGREKLRLLFGRGQQFITRGHESFSVRTADEGKGYHGPGISCWPDALRLLRLPETCDRDRDTRHRQGGI